MPRTIHLEDSLKHRIEAQQVYVHVEDGHDVTGTEGEDMLLYAMYLQKPIIVWRPKGYEHCAIPKQLDVMPFTWWTAPRRLRYLRLSAYWGTRVGGLIIDSHGWES